MGIKSSEPPKAVPVAAAPSAVLSPEEQVSSGFWKFYVVGDLFVQRRMQSDLETNYEVARQQTHRNKYNSLFIACTLHKLNWCYIPPLSRGLGLGFTSAEPYSAPPPPQGGLVLGGFVPKNH